MDGERHGDLWRGERGRLIGLAYRLLGSVAEAEDAVQEAFTRWYALSEDQQREIASPPAWMTTVTSRICLDALGSARARRERYVGEWIPEPVPEQVAWGGPANGGSADPADRVTLEESISMAFLVMLDAMTPGERVAFILHDVFGYPYTDIARTLGRSPAACRQLASAARRTVRTRRLHETSVHRQATLVRAFRRAWAARDIAALVALLDPDATAVTDGGGLVSATLTPVEGADAIAVYYADLLADGGGELVLAERAVNGRPGLVVLRGGVAVTVMAFEVRGDRITWIWAVRNPEKLGGWQPS